jgi:16S rRNA processing protein RimM
VVARPHGVRGELRLMVYNSDSELLFDRADVLVRRPKGTEAMMQLESVRGATPGYLLAKFRGVNDRDAADELRDAEICVERTAFPELEPGEFYVCDIIGARLVGPNGDIGEVEAFVSYPSADVLVVSVGPGNGSRRKVELPLVDNFVESVDAKAGRVNLHAEAIAWLDEQAHGSKIHED